MPHPNRPRPSQLHHHQTHGAEPDAPSARQGLPTPQAKGRRMGRGLPRQPHHSIICSPDCPAGTWTALTWPRESLAMLTRREMLVLTGVGAAGAAAVLSGRDARAAIAAQTPIDFDVPRGACDCHAHVFPDPARFPFTSNRVYTPSVAMADDL